MTEWYIIMRHPEIPGFLLIMMAIVLSVIFVFVYVVFWCLRNCFSPITRVRATVIRKKAKHWDASTYLESYDIAVPPTGVVGHIRRAFLRLTSMLGLSDIQLLEGTNCFVTFYFDGRELDFNVPLDKYRSIREGAQGILVFKGERFVRFIPVYQEKDPGQLMILR